MNFERLKHKLTRHEGKKKSAYKDSLGYWTIGVGRCIDARLKCGLAEDEIDYLLNNDINATHAKLEAALPWFTQLNDIRQEVLVNMSFNLGVAGLLEFKRTLQFIKEQRWSLAAEAMLDSKWADQVGSRAVELAQMMRTGVDSE